MRKLGWTLVAAGVLGAGSAAALSPAQVSAGFAEGAVRYCLEAGLRGVEVRQLPAELRAGLAPAGADMRGMVEASNPKGPLWDVLSAKGIVVVSEPSPGVCEVVAYGAPVAKTFKGVMKDAKKRAPELAEVKVTPGYDPIVFRLERPGGVRLDLSGAEPGAPGRMFRFSMLSAKVTRTP